jgi:hypothetical protein
MRLSTPGAVLIAGALVLAGCLFHAAFPRYEMKTLNDGAVVRFDRWTAQSELATGDLPAWAATAARSPWPAPRSRATVVEGMVLLAACGALASWRARRAWRVARVRRRLDSMIASDASWLQRV